MNQNDNKYYESTDLCLVVTISLQQAITGISKDITGKATFCFADTPKLQQLLNAYWDNRLQVEPKQFFGQLKIIKQRLYGNG
jgi:hypothetical protein